MTYVQLLTAFATSHDWPSHQLKVRMCLQWQLKEEVSMKQSPGLVTEEFGMVCKLKRSVYGLNSLLVLGLVEFPMLCLNLV